MFASCASRRIWPSRCLAPGVAGFADHDDRAAPPIGTPAQQAHGGGQRIVKTRSAVPGLKMGDGLFNFVAVRAEGQKSSDAAVITEDRGLSRSANDRLRKNNRGLSEPRASSGAMRELVSKTNTAESSSPPRSKDSMVCSVPSSRMWKSFCAGREPVRPWCRPPLQGHDQSDSNADRALRAAVAWACRVWAQSGRVSLAPPGGQAQRRVRRRP